MALFGNNRPAASSSNLVEFRAGKLSLNPQNNMVTPDKRKGMVYMNQSEDTLMHFCWKDRTTGTVEDDLIIFPGDAHFARCKSSKNNRVFIMKMKDTGRKYFFWMQEPKDEKDEELYKKVNDFLNNGPSAASASSSTSSGRAVGGGPGRTRGGRGAGGLFGAAGGAGGGMPGGLDSLTPEQMALMQQMFTGGGGAGGIGGLSPGDINSEALDAAFGGLDQQQFWQLFSLMGGAGSLGGGSGATGGLSALAGAGLGGDSGSAGIGDTPNTGGLGDNPSQLSTPASTDPAGSTPTTLGADSAASHVQLSDLQSILANMNLPAGARLPGDSAGAALAAALAGSSDNAAAGEDIQSNEELMAAASDKKDTDKKDKDAKDKGDKKDKGPDDEEMELD